MRERRLFSDLIKQPDAESRYNTTRYTLQTTTIQRLTLIFVLTVSLALIIYSCKDDPVAPPSIPTVLKDTINISIEDVTHRSICVNIKTTANVPSSTIEIYRRYNNADTLAAEFPITIRDTTIIDDRNYNGLLLNTEYSYFAVRRDSTGEKKDTSNIITAQTLAPTSHNYTWQEYTLGEWQSVLYDVWGTDENNVYAVGGVTINDTIYGVLKWNGTEWIPFSSVAGGYAIYGFSDSDIWTVGGGVWHYDGVEWERYTYRDPVINANSSYTSVWGTSSNNLYLGSYQGTVLHWDGTRAEVVYDAGNPVTDIKGTSENNIWFTAYESSTFTENIIHFDGYSWQRVHTNPMGVIYTKALEVFTSHDVIAAGSAMYYWKGDFWEPLNIVVYSITLGVDGSSSTNVFGVGGYCLVYHYNGTDVHFYENLFSQQGGNYYGVKVFNNKVFIVGEDENINAKILIGERN